jgi:hypothetical protein
MDMWSRIKIINGNDLCQLDTALRNQLSIWLLLFVVEVKYCLVFNAIPDLVDLVGDLCWQGTSANETNGFVELSLRMRTEDDTIAFF